MRPDAQVLDAEEAALRHAIARADFAAAEAAAGRYRTTLDSLLPELPLSEAAERLLHACDLFDWARCHLRSARAELQSLSHYCAAVPVAPAPTHTWKLDV